MNLRRLHADWMKVDQLISGNPLISVETQGMPPTLYRVTFWCRGLAWPKGAPAPCVTARHQAEIYLHNEYPRRPPRILWLTDIFHPNILPPERNGGVCIGAWTPAESLDQLIVRLGEMVQYKQYGLKDPLDPVAARWAAAHAQRFPVDDRPLIVPERPPHTAVRGEVG